MAATLNVHSTGLIYSPGIFDWIMAHGSRQHKRKRELLAALGIPEEFIQPIIKGNFDKRVEGETLVITIK
jgi:hypothetical protein